MKNLLLSPTAKTPEINFSSEGILKVSGRSIPENAHTFYEPILEWLSEYAYSPFPKTTLILELEYFNTSSSKCILDIFKIVEKLFREGRETEIVWRYEEDDQDMIEAGEDYDSIIRAPIKFVEIV